MKKFIIPIIILLISSMSSPVFSQQDNFIKDYIERLENSKQYLIEVAESMPEVKYSYKVTPESMSFEEHLMHIAWAMDWHCQSLLGERKARDWYTDNTLKVHNKTKEEMIATIELTFDNTINFINNFDENKLKDRLDYLGLNRTKMQVLLLLTDHITHHRAQMLVSLRLNNIKPPRYILFQ